jgi:hypothetical protein
MKIKHIHAPKLAKAATPLVCVEPYSHLERDVQRNAAIARPCPGGATIKCCVMTCWVARPEAL